MEAKLNHVFWSLTYRFNYEVDGVIRHFFYALLNDMVAILIVNAVKNCIFELLNQKFLLVKRNKF
jgi:hypothetical protein